MLERPDVQDERILACLRDAYGVPAVEVLFLPLGADPNTAVFRVVAGDRTPYFLKLRSGAFDETSVALPKFLSDQGIAAIIPPLATSAGQLWASVEAFRAIVYPFVEGRTAYEGDLSERQWADLGAALRRIHTAILPLGLSSQIQRETCCPKGRETVKMALERIEHDSTDDPVAAEMAAFLKIKRNETLDLVGRAEALAQALRARPPELVLCHSDVHAGNVFMDGDGALYIVDWDNPILAPKERDLMVAGSGLMGNWRTPQEEEALFYRGYGPTEIDPTALAYYRYERIVQDIAVYCEQLLSTTEGGEDRAQSLGYLKSNFLAGGTIEIACQSDRTDRRRSVRSRR